METDIYGMALSVSILAWEYLTVVMFNKFPLLATVQFSVPAA